MDRGTSRGYAASIQDTQSSTGAYRDPQAPYEGSHRRSLTGEGYSTGLAASQSSPSLGSTPSPSYGDHPQLFIQSQRFADHEYDASSQGEQYMGRPVQQQAQGSYPTWNYNGNDQLPRRDSDSLSLNSLSMSDRPYNASPANLAGTFNPYPAISENGVYGHQPPNQSDFRTHERHMSASSQTMPYLQPMAPGPPSGNSDMRQPPYQNPPIYTEDFSSSEAQATRAGPDFGYQQMYSQQNLSPASQAQLQPSSSSVQSSYGFGGAVPLQRGPTTMSTSSNGSLYSMAPSFNSNSPTSFMASSAQFGDAVPIQPAPKPKKTADTLPYNRAFVDDYRTRVKSDPDPEAQWQYSQYLIEAARRICVEEKQSKQAIKFRDSLLAEVHKLIKKLATEQSKNEEVQLKATFFLADCYSGRKLDFECNPEKAYTLYLNGATRNHPQSTYRAAMCKERGLGTNKDFRAAANFYKRAADLGDTEAMYEVFKILYKDGRLGLKGDPPRAFNWLRRASAQSDEDFPIPVHTLAMIYEKGRQGVTPADPPKAFELYTQAAHFGYAESQDRLGKIYEYGELSVRSFNEQQRFILSRRGVAVNPKLSVHYYLLAAKQGLPAGQYHLSGWYLTGCPGVLEQSDREAYLCALKAAKLGSADAAYAVGYYTEVGIGVPKSLDEARTWYMRAASQQHKKAQERLLDIRNKKGLSRKQYKRGSGGNEDCCIQ